MSLNLMYVDLHLFIILFSDLISSHSVVMQCSIAYPVQCFVSQCNYVYIQGGARFYDSVKGGMYYFFMVILGTPLFWFRINGYYCVQAFQAAVHTQSLANCAAAHSITDSLAL